VDGQDLVRQELAAGDGLAEFDRLGAAVGGAGVVRDAAGQGDLTIGGGQPVPDVEGAGQDVVGGVGDDGGQLYARSDLGALGRALERGARLLLGGGEGDGGHGPVAQRVSGAYLEDVA